MKYTKGILTLIGWILMAIPTGMSVVDKITSGWGFTPLFINGE